MSYKNLCDKLEKKPGLITKKEAEILLFGAKSGYLSKNQNPQIFYDAHVQAYKTHLESDILKLESEILELTKPRRRIIRDLKLTMDYI